MKQKSKDFFQSIAEFPHNIGIYLTYTLNTEVIDKLKDNTTGTILILHDFRQGKNIEDNDNSEVVCLPIKTLNPNDKNCFHSKLAILKNETKAKLIIGSANLSKDSFVIEKEIALELELHFNNESEMFVYNEIIAYIDGIKHQLLTSKEVLEKTIDKLKINGLPPKSSNTKFIHNATDKSIFSETKRYLSEHRNGQEAKSIKIATPFVSENYHSIELLKEITKNISVYVRSGAKIESFLKHQFNIYQPITKKREGFHAKVILIEYENDSVLFIGSANFTEQGYFNTLNNGANNECGILIPVSNEEMIDWFNETHWKQLTLSDIESYKESSDNSIEDLESADNYYAWAENENESVVIYIYNPNQLSVTKTKEGNKIQLKKVDGDYLFKTYELKKQDQIVTFYIGGNKVSIAVFDMKDYQSRLEDLGESIFASFKGINSVNPNEMDEAIGRDKISVSESMTIKITEPPKLEQYYYTVKYLIQNIKRKKYFSEYNEKEIQEKISIGEDGRTLYLVLQLAKLFSERPNSVNLSKICEDRLFIISDKLNINKKLLTSFINKWPSSKI